MTPLRPFEPEPSSSGRRVAVASSIRGSVFTCDQRRWHLDSRHTQVSSISCYSLSGFLNYIGRGIVGNYGEIRLRSRISFLCHVFDLNFWIEARDWHWLWFLILNMAKISWIEWCFGHWSSFLNGILIANNFFLACLETRIRNCSCAHDVELITGFSLWDMIFLTWFHLTFCAFISVLSNLNFRTYDLWYVHGWHSCCSSSSDNFLC